MHKHHLLDVDINRLEATDLLKFYDLRLHHRKNPLTDYLNISSLRNKISDLSVFLHDLQLHWKWDEVRKHLSICSICIRKLWH